MSKEKMTIEEAIQHAEEKAAELKRININKDIICEKCAEDHQQLAEWLRELQMRRNQLEEIQRELWWEGVNIGGEYQGVWVRYRNIEKIIEKYKEANK